MCVRGAEGLWIQSLISILGCSSLCNSMNEELLHWGSVCRRGQVGSRAQQAGDESDSQPDAVGDGKQVRFRRASRQTDGQAGRQTSQANVQVVVRERSCKAEDTIWQQH